MKPIFNARPMPLHIQAHIQASGLQSVPSPSTRSAGASGATAWIKSGRSQRRARTSLPCGGLRGANRAQGSTTAAGALATGRGSPPVPAGRPPTDPSAEPRSPIGRLRQRSSSSSKPPQAEAGHHSGGGPQRPHRTAPRLNSTDNSSPHTAPYHDDYASDGSSDEGGDPVDAIDGGRREERGAAGTQQPQRWRRPPPDPGGDLSYSRRVALLRKPALTAADKLSVGPEERARIARVLRTPRRWPRGGAPSSPPLLRVFVYGIDDVRLYKAAEGAGLLGRLVVVPSVAAGDAVLACRIKRTGRAVELREVSNAARNAGVPLLELPALSAVRLAEAVGALTGWPVPPHLRARPPRPVDFLPPLERDGSGCGAALVAMTGGLALPDYIASRPDFAPPEGLLREMDRIDDPLYGDSLDEQPPSPPATGPQERGRGREAPRTGGAPPAPAPARALARPHMEGSLAARQRLLARQRRAREEAEGRVPW